MNIQVGKNKSALILILGVLLFSLPGLAADREDSSNLTQAEEIYTALLNTSPVEMLSGSTAAKARKIWLAYKKKLIALNARIEINRMDASEQTGLLREKALDNLIATAGQRERLAASTVQQLMLLTKTDGGARQQPTPVKASVEPAQLSGPTGAPEVNGNFRQKNLSVISESEDLSTGEFE